jgi:hypothetical protein
MNARVIRIVMGFCFLAWFINAPGNPGFIRNFNDALERPIRIIGAPAPLIHPLLAIAFYALPLTLLLGVRSPERFGKLAAVVYAVSAGALCMHIETCNDATFVTALWVSLWLLWFTWNADRTDRAFQIIARGLAHGIISLVFLGALVGKLTLEYTSGEAFYGLYFARDQGFPYPYLRSHFTQEDVRSIATWFSRFAIVSECALACSVFLPTRVVTALLIGVSAMMMLARNYNLFSVLGSLIGLMVATLIVDRDHRLSAKL